MITIIRNSVVSPFITNIPMPFPNNPHLLSDHPHLLSINELFAGSSISPAVR